VAVIVVVAVVVVVVVVVTTVFTAQIRSTRLSTSKHSFIWRKTLRVKLRVWITHQKMYRLQNAVLCSTNTRTMAAIRLFCEWLRCALSSFNGCMTFDRTARVRLTRSIRHPSSPPVGLESVKTYQHQHHYSTPLLINEGNKKRTNIFVRKFNGLVSTEKEETQELWTTPMKTEYIGKSINWSGSYCYFVRTVIVTLHSIQHGEEKKHRQF
jgi:hypothetical protein